MKLKALAILLIIVISLIPVYALYKYLQKIIQPRESGRRFLSYLLAVCALIFAYTFLVVFIIRMIFPGA